MFLIQNWLKKIIFWSEDDQYFCGFQKTCSLSFLRFSKTFQYLLYRSTDHKGPILSCNFSPSGRLGMTGGIDGKTLVWM